MFIYKAIRKTLLTTLKPFEKLITRILFWGNNVKHQGFSTNGIPYVMVAIGGKCSIGKNFAMNNGAKGNPIGSFRRCTFFVNRGATLTIGDNVGISQTALVCQKSITTLNNVKIEGGGVPASMIQISIPSIRRFEPAVKIRSTGWINQYLSRTTHSLAPIPLSSKE